MKKTKDKQVRASIKKWFDGLATDGFPDEFEAKRLLNMYDIATPKGFRLYPDDDLSRVQLDPPYALKVCTGNMLHKTEQNAVLLNLNEGSLFKAVTDFRKRFSSLALLIEEQIDFKGPEFIIGATVDPDFGPAVMAGMGGIFTEIYRDVTFRLAPCTAREALCMLQELTLAPVLQNFREIHMDAQGLANLISKVGDLIFELGDAVYQLDINPLVFSGSEWIALDAKIILAR